MADDPRKKGADRKRVSQQTHEQSYQRKKRRVGGEQTISSRASNRSESRSGDRSESTGRGGSYEGR